MDAARRLYLYMASAIGLAAFALGMIGIVRWVITEVAGGHGYLPSGSGPSSELSMAVALVAIGVPVWLIHWTVIRRAQRGDDDASLAERRSTVRALYLAVVLLASLVVLMSSTIIVIDGLTKTLVSLSVATAGERGEGAATVLVAGAIWLAHARLLSRDLLRTQLRGAAAWLPRLARYAGTGLGLAVLLTGAGLVTTTLVDVFLGGSVISTPASWWARAIGGTAAMVVVGAVAWWLHWRNTEAVIHDRALIGEDDRRTHVRALYFGGVQLAAAVAVAAAISVALYGLLMGSTPPDEIVRAGLVALPVVVAALWHLRVGLAEASALDAEAGSTQPHEGYAASHLPASTARVDAERRLLLITAFPGLLVLGSGAIWLLTTVLERAASSTAIIVAAEGPTSALADYAEPIAVTLAGLITWIAGWSRASGIGPGRSSGHPATAWMVYLYAALLASLAVLVPDAAFSLYRLVDWLLGGGSASQPLLPDQALPIAALMVSSVGFAYHGWLLRSTRPQSLRSVGRRAASPSQTLEPDGAIVSVELTLHLPVDADVEVSLERIRGVLVRGARIEIASSATKPPVERTTSRSGSSRPPSQDASAARL